MAEEIKKQKSKDATYVLVADQTEEFEVALRYAARVAGVNGARIAIIYVLEKQDFQHWGNIEERMRKEQRSEAEQFLFDMARRVNEISGIFPALYIRSGSRLNVLLEVLKEDKNITKLILGGAVNGAPGPLVSHFSTKGLGALGIPITIVPGNLEMHQIDSLL